MSVFGYLNRLRRRDYMIRLPNGAWIILDDVESIRVEDESISRVGSSGERKQQYVIVALKSVSSIKIPFETGAQEYVDELAMKVNSRRFVITF